MEALARTFQEIDPQRFYCVVVFHGDGSIKEICGPMGQASASAMAGDISAISTATQAMPYARPAVAMAMSRRPGVA